MRSKVQKTLDSIIVQGHIYRESLKHGQQADFFHFHGVMAQE